MATEHFSDEVTQRLYEERLNRGDTEILTELRELQVLPDEDDPCWDGDAVWQQLDLFLTLAHHAAARKLEAAIPLLLERACYGDPYETMRGLRHYLERIVNPDWWRLTQACMAATQYPQSGARLWAVAELGILRDPQTLITLIHALEDPAERVRVQACSSLEALCQRNESCHQPALAALQRFLLQYPDAADQRAGQEALRKIMKMPQGKR